MFVYLSQQLQRKYREKTGKNIGRIVCKAKRRQKQNELAEGGRERAYLQQKFLCSLTLSRSLYRARQTPIGF